MLRPENVATPPDACTVVGPLRVALTPAGLISSTVTKELSVVTGAPDWSTTCTVRPKPAPACVEAGGCCVTTRCGGTVAVMLNGLEVALALLSAASDATSV